MFHEIGTNVLILTNFGLFNFSKPYVLQINQLRTMSFIKKKFSSINKFLIHNKIKLLTSEHIIKNKLLINKKINIFTLSYFKIFQINKIKLNK